LEGLFWVGNKVGCSFFMEWVWTLGFTLDPAKGFNSNISLAIFSPFLWTLSKV
jgi:hypothetical protein